MQENVSAPTTSPDCDELREWLTEEEENESCSSSRPENLNASIPAPIPGDDSRPSIDSEENPYTPCPRRSDYDNSEFIGSTIDPFDDSFYTDNTTNNSHQNLYVSPQFVKEKTKSECDRYENVVEICSSPDPPPTHLYVNVPPIYPSADNIISSESDDVFRDEGKMKIDGSSITFVGFVSLTSVSSTIQRLVKFENVKFFSQKKKNVYIAVSAICSCLFTMMKILQNQVMEHSILKASTCFAIWLPILHTF